MQASAQVTVAVAESSPTQSGLDTSSISASQTTTTGPVSEQIHRNLDLTGLAGGNVVEHRPGAGATPSTVQVTVMLAASPEQFSTVKEADGLVAHTGVHVAVGNDVHAGLTAGHGHRLRRRRPRTRGR